MTADAEDPADLARELMRRCDRASLATVMEEDGAPYVSLVLVACDSAARPLLLLSDLARHSRNLAQDARAALLYDGTAGHANPLTGARVTVLGRIEACDDEGLAARFFARHPRTRAFSGFADFRLRRLVPTRAHLVAGFGKAHWIEGERLLRAEGPDAGA